LDYTTMMIKFVGEMGDDLVKSKYYRQVV
jgi:hypothetical protein